MTLESVEYRSQNPADLPEVISLLKLARLPVQGVEDLGRNLIVATSGGRVIGAAGLEIHGSDALLRSVVVADDWRGQGIGRELVIRIMEIANGLGLRSIYLLTEGAADYFESFGFSRVSRNSVTGAVARSAEFSHLCPSSAVAMMLTTEPARVRSNEKRTDGSVSQR